MNILFWNTHGNNNINKYIYELVEEYEIDTLILFEYKSNREELNSLLLKSVSNLRFYNNLGCERVVFYSNRLNIDTGPVDDYYAIHMINKEVIICSTHLMSNMDSDNSQERYVWAQSMIYEIDKERELHNTNKVIILGDFNEMPYGMACLSANAFHGLPVYDQSSKPSRTVKHRLYRKYYNPMWNLMGDNNYPPGTYYYNNSKLSCTMWHMVDQIIVSWEIANKLDKNSLKIITKTRRTNFATKTGRPNKEISDHFPVFCKINI